jgi:DNA-binding CsgD family transcriptional regulator
LIRGKGVIAEGRVFNNQMLCPINEYLRSEYYNDCLRTLDVCHIMGGSVLDGSGTAALLSLMRPQSAPAFSHEEMRTLSVLMPHLKQAVALRTRLREVELVKEGLAAALDWITLGVILISPALEILAANRSAREILAASDGLACTRGQLQVTDRTARDQLGMLLRAGRGDARLPAGGPISVPRPSMRRNYALFVCLAPPKLAAFVGGNRRRFSIFIVAPETVPQPPCELLVRWFGLTPAEARLTMILLQGLTLKEAAEQLAVARNTVHSQLASVFSKTGTRRQSELVKLLSGVAQLRYGAGGGSAA